MKVLRSTLVAALVAVAAACGDKVTVAGPANPPDTTPKVNSVTVSPATATMTVGQTVSFTSVVDVSNGAATTVTWSSSDATKVSVTAAGVATAVAATPGVAICATSTADATKKGCASVAVSATTNIPATVSIQSITATGNTNTTVNPAAVAGNIDVRLNINPGSQTLTRVDLKLGTVTVGSQTFTAAQSAALRWAADEAIANQTTFPQILFTVNTAAITSTTTGAVQFTNGNYTLSAQLYAGGSATAATATAQQSLTLANADGWLATVSTSGTTANALNAGGFRYNRGGLTVSAVPVSYTGAVVASGTVTFGSVACDASGIGARTVALVAPAAGSSAWTATIAATGAAGAGNLNGYEFNGCAASNATGETPTVTAVNSAGNALFTAAAPLNAGAATNFRMDNRGPLNPAGSTNAGTGIIRINTNPNGRASGWINDAVTFNSTAVTTATTNGFLCVNPAGAVGVCTTLDTLPRDAGVGSPTYYVKVGATKTAATTAAGLTSPASLAASATNTSYCAIAYGADALGNETASPSTATACGAEINNVNIGVDRAAPTIAYSGGIAANARLSGGTVGAEFTVTVNDTGLVGNSGMLPASPVLMSLTRRVAGAANSAGTTTIRFADNSGAMPAGTTLSATGVAAAAPLYSTSFTGTTGAANHAYWTHNATARDAAGNSASVTPRVMVYDAAAPVPGAPSAPLTITATGYSTSAFINEDLDIQDYSFGVNYGAVAPFTPATAQLQQPVNAVNGFNAATFANTNYGVTTTVSLPLALQANVAAGLTNMVSISTTARSQSNLAATSGVFTPATVTPGAAISTTNMTTFGAATGATAAAFGGGAGTGIVTGNTTAASATSTGPLQTNVTITQTVVGTTAIFNNPFSRIDFYMLGANGTQYFLVGSSASPTLNDNGATRTYTYTISLNGPTIYGILGGAGATWTSNIVAVGVNASGTIAMVNGGALVVNVVF